MKKKIIPMSLSFKEKYKKMLITLKILLVISLILSLYLSLFVLYDFHSGDGLVNTAIAILVEITEFSHKGLEYIYLFASILYILGLLIIMFVLLYRDSNISFKRYIIHSLLAVTFLLYRTIIFAYLFLDYFEYNNNPIFNFIIMFITFIIIFISLGITLYIKNKYKKNNSLL